MRKTLGYMVTWTTYGTWLQGDERRWVKDGEVYEASPELHKANEKQIKGEKVRLDKREKEIVREVIRRKAEEIGEKILALSVWSNHVHIVVSYSRRPLKGLIRIYKNTSTTALRGNEFKGRVWTRGYDKRYCFDEEVLKNRIKYVEGHGT